MDDNLKVINLSSLNSINDEQLLFLNSHIVPSSAF